MSKQKLYPVHRSPARTEVRAEQLVIHIPAFLACILVSLVIWYFMVIFPTISEEPPADSGAVSETVEPVDSGFSAPVAPRPAEE